jgi:phage/plasmid-associated DNA primase
LSLAFGADITKGFDNWCYKYKVNIAKPEWIKNIENELPAFVEEVKKANSSLWNFAYDKTRKDVAVKDAKKKAKQNTYGTFLSTYLQEMEYQLVITCMERLATTTTIFKHPNSKRKERVGSYEYDGFKALSANCEGIDVLGMLHQFSAEFGLPVEWVRKELDDIIDISKELEEVAIELSPDEELSNVITRIRSLDTDTMIVNFVAEHFPDQFVWNRLEKEWYCWSGEKWETGDRIFRLTLCDKVYPIILGLLEPYAERFEDKNEDDPNYQNYDACMKFCHQTLRKRLQNQMDHNLLSGMAKTIFARSISFNTNRMLLGFTNGVYDFDEEVFRPYRYLDYMTMNCGYALETTYGLRVVNASGEIFEDDRDMSENDSALFVELMDVLDKIFPDTSVQVLALQIMATGLVGVAIENLIIWNGGGRNGKGMLNEFLKIVLGDYMVWGDKMLLSETSSNSTGNANPAIAELNKKRYVVLKEPPEDKPINNETYKDMTGGGEVKGRLLYSNDNCVHLFLTMILECNNKPPLKNKPTQADAQRIIDIPFVSTFVVGGTEDPVDEANHKYQRNPSLKNMDWKIKMAQPMMNMLIKYCLRMKTQNWIFEKPQVIIDRGLQYCLNSTPEHNILKELLEIRNPDTNYEDDRDVTIKQIWLAFKQRIDLTSDKAEKKSLKKITQVTLMEFLNTTRPYKNDFYNNGSRHTYCLRNWRRKPDEDDALNEDEH